MQSDSNIAWLRGPRFDFFFIFGPATVAIISGFVVISNNSLFIPVLVADLWILGYHHVVATYTRLAFDRQSFAERRGLIVYLLPTVTAAVVVLVTFGGLWLVTTIYLYWQWWHYTRQSEGISKAFAAKTRSRSVGDPRITRAAFYAVPVAGILSVSNRDPGQFLFFPLKTIPVTDTLVAAALAGAATLSALWIYDQIRAWRSGRSGLLYVMYVLTHYLVYILAYVYIDEINYGWLVINVWHNSQYILFVWLYNNRRFAGKVDPKSLFLSTISQNGRFVLYIATCLTLSTLVYFVISHYIADALASAFALTTTAIALIIYQSINFHHYIVDALIWKLRAKKMQTTLGLG